MNTPTYNDWFTWSFNDRLRGRRLNKDERFTYSVTPNLGPVGNYYDELYNNARAMRDTFTGKFDVLFSGGIDSEVVVRVFKDLGITHNTFIFRFENDINYRDVKSAVEIAEGLNIPYKIIDLDIQKFYENEAWALFEKTSVPRAARLQHLKFFEYLDNIPVMGDGEPYWRRDLGDDYTQKSTWSLNIGEDAHASSIYLWNQGRESICDWYEYTPNVIRSMSMLPYVRQLFNDEIYGKKSLWTSRVGIHQHLWPDVKPKMKLVGLESGRVAGSYPAFVNELQTKMDDVASKDDYWLTVAEFDKLMELDKPNDPT
jgi:hypothetical protein